MSTNCVRCISNHRDGADPMCVACRRAINVSRLDSVREALDRFRVARSGFVGAANPTPEQTRAVDDAEFALGSEMLKHGGFLLDAARIGLGPHGSSENANPKGAQRG